MSNLQVCKTKDNMKNMVSELENNEWNVNILENVYRLFTIQKDSMKWKWTMIL